MRASPELQSCRHCPGEHGHPFLSERKGVRLSRTCTRVRMGGEEKAGAPGVPRRLAINDDI